MFECLIMGDSLAVGTAHFRKECVVIARNGINSGKYLSNFIDGVAFDSKTTIISLGSNDSADQMTYDNLQKIRAKINSGTVYWIIPNIKEKVRKQVWMVAHENGDRVLDARNYDRSPDHIHPTYKGYKELAKDTKWLKD